MENLAQIGQKSVKIRPKSVEIVKNEIGDGFWGSWGAGSHPPTCNSSPGRKCQNLWEPFGPKMVPKGRFWEPFWVHFWAQFGLILGPADPSPP